MEAVKKNLLDDVQGAPSVRSAAALERVASGGLPTAKDEEYRFTPITRVLEKDFTSLLPNQLPSSVASIESYLIPGVNANVIVFTNGEFNTTLSNIITDGSKLRITPLLDNDGGESEKTEKDPFAYLNLALWSSGVSLHVPAGVVVDEPVLVIQINDSTEDTPANHTRLVANVEAGGKLTIIERFEGIGEHTSFTNITEEINVADGASFDYYKVQNESRSAVQVCNTLIRQADKSIVNTFTLTMNGQLVRNNLTIQINGEYCESHFHGLYLLNGKTLADNHTVVDHMKPNSFSNELYKGIMDGQSKGVFNGKIFVRPHAQKTNAFQSNRNVLLSDAATINTKPQLEIWADDVKCSHGCTTGQLDEEALFYLQSRGIGAETARAMLLYAFAAEVLETVSNADLKNYFDHLIAERLHKNF